MGCGFPLDKATQIAFSNLVFVYVDNNDYPTWARAAAEIMHSSVNNFGLLEYLFSIGAPSQPIIAVFTTSQGNGGCNSGWETPIVVGPGNSPADLDWTPMLFLAELTEEFCGAFNAKSGAQGGKFALWQAGNSLGEGLSRAIAFMIYRVVEQTHTSTLSAATWLNSGRPDWVSVNKGTDTDAVSYGCALLFLNFLRYELKFGWQAIVQTRGIPAGSNIFNRTLAAMYQDLTGSTDAYARFAGLLATAFPASTNATLTSNNVFPLARSGGLMVQGSFGNRGNFEVVVPHAGGGLVHLWRNNDDPALPWILSTPNAFFADKRFEAVSIVQSNLGRLPGGFGDPGDLHGVGRVGNALYHFVRNDTGWHLDAQPFATGVTGTPSIIQSHYGFHGNFEVVTPMASGGLAHWFRNNDAPPFFPWVLNANQGDVFGLGKWNNSVYSEVSLIQGGLSTTQTKPLALLARLGTDLLYFESEPLSGFVQWKKDADIVWGPHRQNGSGVTGAMSLIQGHFGTNGNFEAVCPSVDAGVLHMWRNNDGTPPHIWDIHTFMPDLGKIHAVTVIQSNYGNPGNIEGIIRIGSNLWHYWRDGFGWHHGAQPFYRNAQA